MTPVYDKKIDHGMAWRGSDIRSKDEISFDLNAAQVHALEDVLGRVKHLQLQDIVQQDCRHPVLDEPLSKVVDEIQLGRGFLVLRGIPVAEHSDDDIEKMFVALNTLLGTVLSQNPFGMLAKRVQDEYVRVGRPSDLPSETQSYASSELSPHTDTCEILTLLCVRQAREGGATQFASGLAIHNEILATRPDVLPILYRGFPYLRRGVQLENQALTTPYDVPVFSNVDGKISIQYIIGSILGGFDRRGLKPTDEELEALVIFQDTATRLQYDLRFEPGEAAVVNNYTMVHSRSNYVDWADPAKRRLLLRVWVEAARHRRPVVREIHQYENAGNRSGIDPVSGPKITMKEDYGVPEGMLDLLKSTQRKLALAASD